MTPLASIAEADAVRERVHRALADSPYQGYAYSYPHKTTYRPLDPPQLLADVWSDEAQGGAGLYVHIPFCEMRCGFCNLFTAANLAGDAVDAYLDALASEMRSAVMSTRGFAPSSLTIGGGTPTYLDVHQLGRLFDLIEQHFGIVPDALIETSPGTATPDRLSLLAERGVGRISIGVQSFIESETRAMGRPQYPAQLASALDAIRARPFPLLNIDLIYGASGQTRQSWAHSIREALRWSPEEIFLYPLYVRPLTGLDGRAQNWDTHRLDLYRTGRDLLLAKGYTQISMRMFRKSAGAASGSADGEAGWPQEALLGVGCGARSRTTALHYSTPYAVGRRAVLSVIADYCGRTGEDFTTVRYGVVLDRDTRMRRAVIRSVLNRDGLHLGLFAQRFGVGALAWLPELTWLLEAGMLDLQGDRLVPTDAGLERADAIGPLLYAPAVEARMRSFEAR
jgi:oxygen-independent coproporphyrinogen III oxidase